MARRRGGARTIGRRRLATRTRALLGSSRRSTLQLATRLVTVVSLHCRSLARRALAQARAALFRSAPVCPRPSLAACYPLAVGALLGCRYCGLHAERARVVDATDRAGCDGPVLLGCSSEAHPAAQRGV